IGKAPPCPEIEENAVGIVVAGYELLRPALIHVLPRALEQPLHRPPRDLPGGIIGPVLVAAARIDEMRQIELLDAFPGSEAEQPVELLIIVHGHREAQAHLDAVCPAKPHTRQRSLERSRLAAKPVMRRADAIETDADVVVADLRNASDVILADERTIRRQPDVEAE